MLKNTILNIFIMHSITIPFIRHQTKKPAVVYFDQLSGACSTKKLVELLFSAVFNFFVFFCQFLTFSSEISWNLRKTLKKEKNQLKKITSGLRVPPQGVNQLLNVDQL